MNAFWHGLCIGAVSAVHMVLPAKESLDVNTGLGVTMMEPRTLNAWRILLPLMMMIMMAVSGRLEAQSPASQPSQQTEPWLDKAAASTAAATPIPTSPDAGSLRAASPFNITSGFTVVSDYVFRGINYSEYPGEKAERLNYQFLVNPKLDTKKLLGHDLGYIGVSVWFEWYAGQAQITPNSPENLQEIDYSICYGYLVEAIQTTVEAGWTYYRFPRFAGDAGNTQEWYTQLTFDDKAWWGADSAVLNPRVLYAMDVDLGRNGSWLEFGVSHEFALKDVSVLKETPILKDTSLSPSLTLGVDHGYLNNFVTPADGKPASAMTCLANLLYGLEVKTDVSSALGLPYDAGQWTVGGFLNFSEAFRRELLDDQLFGGFKLGVAW